MALPITVPFTFANASTTQSLSSLDADFSTVYNAVNGIGNGTVSLGNVTITGGNITSNIVTYIEGGANSVLRTVQNKLTESVSVKDFGAVGDGTTNDTAAIQSALNVGNYVYFPAGTYKTTSTITVPASTTIDGERATIHYTGSSIAFNLIGSNITIRNITLYGDYNGTYVNGNIGFYAQQNVFSPALIINPVNYIVIENCTIYNFGQSGVQIYSTYFTNVQNNYIYNCGQHGILLVSAQNCHVTGNTIKNIVPGLTNSAYGISLSRLSEAEIGGVPNTPISLVNGPISVNCVISNNCVEDVLQEVAIDLHSGNNITINGNVVRNCRIGVNLEHATAGSYYATCTNISIAGNSLQGLTSNVSAGIFVDAQSGASEIATGVSISGNTFNYFGISASDPFRGAKNAVIYVNYAAGVSVSGNTFNNSYGRCVALDTLTYDCTIVGNTISNLAIANSTQNAFETLSGSARGTINANTMIGTSGYLVSANSIDSGYGLKVGGENIVYGGAVMGDYITQSRIRSGGYLTSARVIVVWDAAGTVTNTVFEDITYNNSTPTVTKNGTGDFTVSWPSGIFGNPLIYPVYCAADPASSEVRNTQISSTSITSATCKSFNSAGAAIDCSENWLLVWGR